MVQKNNFHAKTPSRIYEAGVAVKTQVEIDAEAPKTVLINPLFFDIKPS